MIGCYRWAEIRALKLDYGEDFVGCLIDSEDARTEALKVIYDEVGAMIAGSTLESCKPIVDMVRKLGKPVVRNSVGVTTSD